MALRTGAILAQLPALINQSKEFVSFARSIYDDITGKRANTERISEKR